MLHCALAFQDSDEDSFGDKNLHPKKSNPLAGLMLSSSE
jgi:hypothetical protein